MKAFIRVDSSAAIGTGHVMRCITLAQQLRKRRTDVHFISAELPGNIITLIEDKGFKVHRLSRFCAESFSPEKDAQQTKQWLGEEESIDWLIVDHYGLDEQWEKKLRQYVKKIMVIDDLANRAHDCDLLLDQNLYRDMNMRYAGLVPASCRLILGPQYALLRDEFYEMRKVPRERDGVVRNIFVFFGGSDPSNITGKTLEALKELALPDIRVDVVVGKANPYRDELFNLYANMKNVTVHGQVDNMAEFMTKADLGIGAGGATTWERCILGLPTITIIVAENQRKLTHAVADYGAIINLGWHEDVQISDIAAAIYKATANPEMLRSIGKRALELMSAQYLGEEAPVVQAMLEVYDGEKK